MSKIESQVVVKVGGDASGFKATAGQVTAARGTNGKVLAEGRLRLANSERLEEVYSIKNGQARLSLAGPLELRRVVPRATQLSTLELHQEVEQMLEQNPFLEPDEDAPTPFEPLTERTSAAERAGERETERAAESGSEAAEEAPTQEAPTDESEGRSS